MSHPLWRKLARRFTLVVCGDALPRRSSLSELSSATSEVTVVRCSEEPDALALCQRLSASVVIARKAFISQFPAEFMQLANYGEGPRVLAVMENEELEESASMLRAGCRGVLPPRFSIKTLKTALLTVLDGEFAAPPKVIAGLVSDLLRAAAITEKHSLTPREQRIRDLIAQGYKNSAIAEALFISPATVRWHKRRLYRKLRESGETKRSPGRISLHTESAAG